MSLSVISLLKALALTVVDVLTKIEPEYTTEEGEGSDPSRVYRMVASGVAQFSVTVWGKEYAPPAGLKVGVKTLVGCG